MERTRTPAETDLIAAFDAVLAETPGEDGLAWVDSDLRRLYDSTSTKGRGDAGESVLRAWLEHHSIDVRDPDDTDSDLVANGVRVEVKTSTIGERRVFVFNQLRIGQGWDVALLLGVVPEGAFVWFVPQHVIASRVRNQHGGAKGDGFTRQLVVNPDKPPAWLATYGGRIEAADPTRLLVPSVATPGLP